MRMPAATFEDLVVWQKAHQFVLSAYRLSRSSPNLNPTARSRNEVSKLLESYSRSIPDSGS
jgi:hypothetical protein